MNDSPIDDDGLRELLVSVLDRDASDAELVRLNELLRNNEQLRRSAARFLCDDSFLAEEIGTIEEAISFIKQSAESASRNRPLSPSLGGLSSTGSEPVVELAPKRSRSFSLKTSTGNRFRTALQFVNSHGLAIAAAATILMVGLGWHYAVMMTKFDRLYSLAAVPDPVEHDRLRKGARHAAMMAGAASVARITGLINCEWAGDDPGLKFGDQLSPGQRLRLSRGLLQVTFETGAKVVVEGPADFVATAPTEALLSHGKIAAAVPRFARGYTIFTPTAEVVDLGTEFGVDVDDAHNTEVHVFDGDVVARPRGEGAAKSELIHARQDEAVQFDSKTPAARRISADRQKFVRRLTPDRSPDELPQLPITKDVALWLAADVMPVMKEGARISTWPDILIGDNRFPDDAWQFDERLCPIWVRDGQGLPAVRFDGWSTYLATSPMATGDRLTAFVVFAPSPASFASQSHGGMLLKYGLDAPSLEFALLPNRFPRARVWASNDDGSTSNVGVLEGQAVEPHYPSAAAYAYDAVNNRAELLVNGKSQGVTTAPKRMEQHAKKYIGTHAQPWWEAYFLGNIYEIVLYDTALDASDRDRVFQYLSSRYGFPLND
ncbi:MAG: hypothetical protein WD738_07895 [Pirellulales bacterium]